MVFAMMTSRDFQEIADAIMEAKRRVQYGVGLQMNEDATARQDAALTALQTATQELATACWSRYKGGYSFNRQKFVEACGFPEA